MSRELIVIAKPNVSLEISNAQTTSFNNRETDSLVSILASERVQIKRLFEVEQMQPASSLAVEGDVELPDLSKYYKVNAPDEKLEELVKQLRSHELVEDAYIKPDAELARLAVEPKADVTPSATADFSVRQGYLDTAPVGIDARYAWNFPGGKGNGVKVIDIEGAWRFSHEDLRENQGGVIAGTPSSDIDWRNHGTAVIGVISGDENSLGITGISPEAKIHAISIFGQRSTSNAILQAANALDSGDIILIELHRPGPRFGEQEREDQKGYIAIEWWPDDFDAILTATAKGVIVVEAAGNGGENLDDEIYENRFNRSHRDSGAIIVGAGAPPPGTHGRTHGPDRSRLAFSNYGSIVDAQGWGREVTTTGYSDLQGGVNEEVWYTDVFSGTSSASPIVVGTLACLQGVVKARGHAPLKSILARDLLRNSGSPQQDAPTRPSTQRIGNRPNLKQLIDDMILKEGIEPPKGDRLRPGEKLRPGELLMSPNGRYGLVMQGDGNLVLYPMGTTNALWSSRTHGYNVDWAVLQDDGNFVIYGEDRALWDTDTHGNSVAWIAVQDDGNVVIYETSGRALWATNTMHH